VRLSTEEEFKKTFKNLDDPEIKTDEFKPRNFLSNLHKAGAPAFFGFTPIPSSQAGQNCDFSPLDC
jgi:hypothetical protein